MCGIKDLSIIFRLQRLYTQLIPSEIRSFFSMAFVSIACFLSSYAPREIIPLELACHTVALFISFNLEAEMGRLNVFDRASTIAIRPESSRYYQSQIIDHHVEHQIYSGFL